MGDTPPKARTPRKGRRKIAPDDAPDKGGGFQRMLRAVNRDIRGVGDVLPADCALAELARELARSYDDGDPKIIPQLRGVLSDLQRLARIARQDVTRARAAAAAAAAAGGTVDGGTPDGAAEEGAAGDLTFLDQVKAGREARRARRAGRESGAPGAADMDGAEQVPGPG